MTRDGLTEENLRDGSVKDISHRSRGRPENKEEFVPERERKKAENEDSKSGKGKRLQMEKIRKSSVRQEAVEDTVEVTPEEKVSGYRKKLHRYEKIPDDDNNLNSQKKSIRKKQLQKQMTKEQAKAGRLSFQEVQCFKVASRNSQKSLDKGRDTSCHKLSNNRKGFLYKACSQLVHFFLFYGWH